MDAIPILDYVLRWAGELVLTEDWIPHMPVTPDDSEVFASQFTLGNTRLEYFETPYFRISVTQTAATPKFVFNFSFV